MKFEWDEAKNQANVAKHGIDFADAVRIFDGFVVTDADERFAYGEVRRVSFGRVNGRLVVAVVHTDRRGATRIISARPAKLRERMRYEEALRTRPDPG